MSENVRQVGFCPHCCNRAPQRLVFTHETTLIVREEREDGRVVEVPHPEWYFVAVCETCGHVILYDKPGEIEPGNFIEGNVVYPDWELPWLMVPSSVRNCYAEAMKVKESSPNSFAVQIRRGLEAICDNRLIDKGKLHYRLKALVKQDGIPPLFATTTEALKDMGNVGAHSGADVDPDHVFSIDALFRAFVEYVYIAPYRLRMFLRYTRRSGEERMTRRERMGKCLFESCGKDLVELTTDIDYMGTMLGDDDLEAIYNCPVCGPYGLSIQLEAAIGKNATNDWNKQIRAKFNAKRSDLIKQQGKGNSLVFVVRGDDVKLVEVKPRKKAP